MKMRLVFLFIALLVVFFSNCTSQNSLCNFSKTQSQTSYDNLVEAVLMKKSCGATTSDSYHLFLHSVGDKIDMDAPVFVADKVQSLNISWVDADQLLISYESARIFQFTNFRDVNQSGALRRVITIIEKQHLIHPSHPIKK